MKPLSKKQQELMEGVFILAMGISIFSMSYMTFNLLDFDIIFRTLWGSGQVFLGITFMYIGSHRIARHLTK